LENNHTGGQVSADLPPIGRATRSPVTPRTTTNVLSAIGLPATMMKLMALALAAAGVQAATPNTSRRQMQVRKPLGARE
jgi:hypothetical protein